jgi:hypothetical protein
MSLSSGTLPYDFGFNGPLNVVGNFHPISGLFAEGSQWAVTASLRGLSSGQLAPPFNLYFNPLVAPSGPYEPKPDASTVANDFFPANATIVNPIVDLRSALEWLWHSYSLDSEYTSREHKNDWLQKIYPNNPSGFLPDGAEWSHRAHNETGRLNELPPEILGVSGIFESDYGEVIFNPYPFFAKTRVGIVKNDSFGPGVLVNPIDGVDKFHQVIVSPFFPAFQKTDGTIISLNNIETANSDVPFVIPSGYDLINDFYSRAHIPSGWIRVNMNASNSGSRILLGQLATDNEIQFDQLMSGVKAFQDRFVWPSGSNQGASAYNFGGRMFVDPLPSPPGTGVYAAVGVNSGQFVPSTTLESGAISYWPGPNRRFGDIDQSPIIYGGVEVEDNNGFEVFDDCIWINDYGIVTRQSGLLAVSPHTGNMMWFRYADTDISSTSNSSPVFGPRGAFRNQNEILVCSGVDSELHYYTLYDQYLNTETLDSVTPKYNGFWMEYDNKLNFIKEETATIEDPEEPNTAPDGSQKTFLEIYDWVYEPGTDAIYIFCQSWGSSLGGERDGNLVVRYDPNGGLDTRFEQKYVWSFGDDTFIDGAWFSVDKDFHSYSPSAFASLGSLHINEPATFSPLVDSALPSNFGPGTVTESATSFDLNNLPEHPTSGVYDEGNIKDITHITGSSLINGTWMLITMRLDKLTVLILGLPPLIVTHIVDDLYLCKIERNSGTSTWDVTKAFKIATLQNGASISDSSWPATATAATDYAIRMVNAPIT